ncbi:winged helix-turn-helix transcriptional regulator [Massilia sp. PWRC2]|uniref:winged helix-turn-helix transcriptional regulator n=1 Tax=Massilia sp. PWRC2 TaxID=2804626 RepID=UPI003CF604C4
MVIDVPSFGALRTGQWQRAMPGVSKKMLTQTLRELEGDGLIVRTVHQLVPSMVDYALMRRGQGFVEPLMVLYGWAQTHAALLDELERNRAAAMPTGLPAAPCPLTPSAAAASAMQATATAAPPAAAPAPAATAAAPAWRTQ